MRPRPQPHLPWVLCGVLEAMGSVKVADTAKGPRKHRQRARTPHEPRGNAGGGGVSYHRVNIERHNQTQGTANPPGARWCPGRGAPHAGSSERGLAKGITSLDRPEPGVRASGTLKEHASATPPSSAPTGVGEGSYLCT